MTFKKFHRFLSLLLCGLILTSNPVLSAANIRIPENFKSNAKKALKKSSPFLLSGCAGTPFGGVVIGSAWILKELITSKKYDKCEKEKNAQSINDILLYSRDFETQKHKISPKGIKEDIEKFLNLMKDKK